MSDLRRNSSLDVPPDVPPNTRPDVRREALPEARSKSSRWAPRDLQLDFLRRSPVTPMLSWVLLGLGIILIGFTIWGHNALTKQLTQERALLASLMPADVSDRRAASANLLLGKPWGVLFSSLEQSRPESIALMQIEASGETGQVLLLAETLSTDDMLDYVKQLREQPGFSNVTLQKHATLDDGPERLIQFTVRLGWGAR